MKCNTLTPDKLKENTAKANIKGIPFSSLCIQKLLSSKFHKKNKRNLSAYFSKQNENIGVTLEKGAETFDMLITTLLIFNISLLPRRK